MKIQYRLIEVKKNTYYSELRNSDASYDFSSEVEYTQKYSEKEVEEWLEAAAAAATIVKTADSNYYAAQWGRKKATREEQAALYEIYTDLLEKYRTEFGCDLINTDSEFRIVKIYTVS